MIFRANFQFSNIDPTLILQLTSKYLISNNTNITYKYLQQDQYKKIQAISYFQLSNAWYL